MALSLRLRDDGDLGLLYPPSYEGGLSHEVRVPLTLHGLAVLKRALLTHDPTKRIGTPAVPTSTMVEEWLKEERKREEAPAPSGLNIEIKL